MRSPIKNRQLGTREKDNLAKTFFGFLAERDQAVATATAKAITEKWLDQDRVLIPGGRSVSDVTFAQVGRTVIKVCSESTTSDLLFNFAKNIVTCSPDRVTVSITPATEGDLLDAQRSLEKHGPGAHAVRIREFLRIVRNEPADPLAIKIVNANELAPAGKVMTVKRGGDGKISGAVVESVPDPS